MIKRLTFIATLLISLIYPFAIAQASPSYMSNTETVWSSGTNDCLRSQSELQANDVNYYNWSATATAQTGIGNYDRCSTPGYQAQDQQLATFLRLWHYDGANWNICADSGWQYNIYPTYSQSTSYAGGYAPCGEGWYGVHSYAARWTGQWNVGGPVWVGSVYLHGDPGYQPAINTKVKPLSIPFPKAILLP